MMKLKTFLGFNPEGTLDALVLDKWKCGAVFHSITVVKGCALSVQLLCLPGACSCSVELGFGEQSASVNTWLRLDRKWAGDGDMCVLGVEASHGVTRSSLASWSTKLKGHMKYRKSAEWRNNCVLWYLIFGVNEDSSNCFFLLVSSIYFFFPFGFLLCWVFCLFWGVFYFWFFLVCF